MHQTNVFVTLHKDVDPDFVSAIQEMVTPEAAARMAVTPAERAAREAQRILLSRQLQETSDLLQGFKRLLTVDTPSPNYMSKDLNDLKNWKATIEKHLSTAALYGDVFNPDGLPGLPRLHLDTVWYRLSRFGGADPRNLYTPGQIPTRFNPGPELGGGFASLALADEISTAAFELSKNLDLADTVEYLKRMNVIQFRVRLANVVDLTNPDTVTAALGVDFGALVGLGFHDRLSVTQKICLALVHSGCSGALFPSRNTVGKKNLVLFANNIRSQQSVTILSTSNLTMS